MAQHASTWTLADERRAAEAALDRGRLDFAGTWMAVSNLQYVIQKDASAARQTTVRTLGGVLEARLHAGQRQAYFLYRKAAGSLATVLCDCRDLALAARARDRLKRLVSGATGPCHRAAAEALGSVPAGLDRLPEPPPHPAAAPAPPPVADWGELVARAGGGRAPRWLGRSLVAGLDDGRVLALKLARRGEEAGALVREAGWMERLAREAARYPVRFDVPRPLTVSGSPLIRVAGLPRGLPAPAEVGCRCRGIVFTTHPDYFAYPNDHRPGRGLPLAEFSEVLGRNAWLLGKLASHGVLHSAPIPLFHNRVQQRRRSDGGLYEWHRAGRLDRWLHSCRYPNLGVTETRDFEHLDVFDGSPRQLYLRVGTHLLSLVLVAGSWFRNRQAHRLGFDAAGNPVDTRDLFDAGDFAALIRRLFNGYYSGFTGREYRGGLLEGLAGLVERMIAEMGIDRHMEEILRVADQLEMTDEGFAAFLRSRGMSGRETAALRRGERDITTHSGPHLGGFNRRISVPELIEFTAGAAACCVGDRFWQQRNGVTPPETGR